MQLPFPRASGVCAWNGSQEGSVASLLHGDPKTGTSEQTGNWTLCARSMDPLCGNGRGTWFKVWAILDPVKTGGQPAPAYGSPQTCLITSPRRPDANPAVSTGHFQGTVLDADALCWNASA